MRKLIYIVICCSVNGDQYYDIDSVWTSKRKAEKRRDELNSEGLECLLEKKGYGLYEVEQMFLSK